MIYFQAKTVVLDSRIQVFAAPGEALYAKMEAAVARRIPHARIQVLDTLPIGVPITILTSAEVC